ncbi:putative membrane protein [Thermolongibacillus altinsuensis]|uniref:Putative membrane protein n=1 Tax=Thermolongibacillus altinsuensis TaxID=575256 RepID=A0A4R1QFM4_9BACL|nr:SdpI family protein [Thermolongibacillus altinsuensis]TCL43127.1 putative membrane protein [Thermolongibacillus altinsuensis]
MKTNRFVVMLMVFSYLLSLIAIPYLPDEVAIHWNLAGEADGYSSKWFGAFILPLAMTWCLLLMALLPKMDPEKANDEKFKGSYNMLINVFALFFIAFHVITLAYNLGFPVDVGLFVPIGVGVLFIVLGNYMPKFKRNYFVGIRTPWTLESETVWDKTHRIGRKVFVLMGFALMLTVFIEGIWNFILFLAITLGGVLYLFVKSYLYFREEQRKV